MTVKQCDVCGEFGDVNVVSSFLAPVTYRKCTRCVAAHAEAAGVVFFWIKSYGVPNFAPDNRFHVKSWISGSYVGWVELLKYYLRNERDIAEDFIFEFNLE